MNYYPTNFYSNYPQTQQSLYGYNQAQIPNYQTNQTQMSVQNNQIPGKIVDSQEVARVSDIPFGGYGVFPKADLSEVFVKVWNNNGTTSLLCFKPMVEGNVVQEQDKEERRYHEGSSQNNYDKMQEKIEMLERKIDELQKTQSQEKMQIIKRKE
jgi:hypothetical protein